MANQNGQTTPMCRLTKRPLGQILVEGGFVSSSDIERALEEQKLSNERLGEVLVRMGVLDERDLNAALSVQRHLVSPLDIINAAAGVRQILGNLLVQARRITHEQLDHALKEQERTGEKLGAILVRLGFLTERELDAVLAFQQNQGVPGTFSAPFKLGEILVAAKYITRQQLDETLSRQMVSQKKIGEVLVEQGYVQPHHIEHGLRIQRMLVTAALIALLLLSSIPRTVTAATSSGSAQITVTATVLPRAVLKKIHETAELIVTQADVSRGYVDIKTASRLEVKNNSSAGYIMIFEGLRNPFKEVHIQGLGSEVRINSTSGLIPQPYIRGTVSVELSYRLSSLTMPGQAPTHGPFWFRFNLCDAIFLPSPRAREVFYAPLRQ